ncbi:rCG59220 [Rattus norvegicus]|uniref:RCG59220 n=1 Tax=Rattus norvegicus TaxID=10116 RepID=A6K7I8_RAT|nr:rCG59220 [Rattus norvegicus]
MAGSLGSRQGTGERQKLGIVGGALLVSLENRMPSGEAQGQD